MINAYGVWIQDAYTASGTSTYTITGLLTGYDGLDSGIYPNIYISAKKHVVPFSGLFQVITYDSSSKSTTTGYYLFMDGGLNTKTPYSGTTIDEDWSYTFEYEINDPDTGDYLNGDEVALELSTYLDNASALESLFYLLATNNELRVMSMLTSKSPALCIPVTEDFFNTFMETVVQYYTTDTPFPFKYRFVDTSSTEAVTRNSVPVIITQSEHQTISIDGRITGYDEITPITEAVGDSVTWGTKLCNIAVTGDEGWSPGELTVAGAVQDPADNNWVVTGETVTISAGEALDTPTGATSVSISIGNSYSTGGIWSEKKSVTFAVPHSCTRVRVTTSYTVNSVNSKRTYYLYVPEEGTEVTLSIQAYNHLKKLGVGSDGYDTDNGVYIRKSDDTQVWFIKNGQPSVGGTLTMTIEWSPAIERINLENSSVTATY